MRKAACPQEQSLWSMNSETTQNPAEARPGLRARPEEVAVIWMGALWQRRKEAQRSGLGASRRAGKAGARKQAVWFHLAGGEGMTFSGGLARVG